LHKNLGWALLAKGESNEAIQQFREALRLYPAQDTEGFTQQDKLEGIAETDFRLGQAYERAGDRPGACGALLAVLAIPNNDTGRQREWLERGRWLREELRCPGTANPRD
jgi:tetratricopeptide (TPR) repeat protein